MIPAGFKHIWPLKVDVHTATSKGSSQFTIHEITLTLFWTLKHLTILYIRRERGPASLTRCLNVSLHLSPGLLGKLVQCQLEICPPMLDSGSDSWSVVLQCWTVLHTLQGYLSIMRNLQVWRATCNLCPIKSWSIIVMTRSSKSRYRRNRRVSHAKQ